jgi:16S rRNA (uracil1498-N3)-methyltransferase
MVEGLLPEGDGAKLLMRFERTEGRSLLRVVSSRENDQAGPKISLLIGLLKADQFDMVLRASSELGLSEIIPVICERSVPRFGSDELHRKLSRWQKILDESSKVSGFVYATKILPPVAFEDFDWPSLPKVRYAALLTEGARPISGLSGLSAGDDAVFAVGPEGDWTSREMSTLLWENFTPVNLGQGVLRSSTAAIIGCGWFRLSCTA